MLNKTHASPRHGLISLDSVISLDSDATHEHTTLTAPPVTASIKELGASAAPGEVPPLGTAVTAPAASANKNGLSDFRGVVCRFHCWHTVLATRRE